MVSHFQVAPLLEARHGPRGGAFPLDTSLGAPGCSKSEAHVREDGVTVVMEKVRGDAGQGHMEVHLAWDDLKGVVSSPNGVFEFTGESGDKLSRVQRFLESGTGRPYSLMATGEKTPPTMLVAGFGMHRILNTDPGRDTRDKVGPLGRGLAGMRCLDTCCGLGYTAIEMARRGAAEVTTVEIDPAGLYVCSKNPWSSRLFGGSEVRDGEEEEEVQEDEMGGRGKGKGKGRKKALSAKDQGRPIGRILGDSYELLPTLPTSSLDRILHDPPALAIDVSGLYSTEIYAEFHRCLSARGKVFHYIGDLSSKSGSATARSAERRLADVGFDVTRCPEAFGLVAAKRRAPKVNKYAQVD